MRFIIFCVIVFVINIVHSKKKGVNIMKLKVERFIIITPRAISPSRTQPRIHPPLGAISVLAEAKKNGFEVFLLDATAEGLKRNILDSTYDPVETEELDGVLYWKTGLKVSEIINETIKLRPDVIGLSCSTVVDRGEIAKIAKEMKYAFPTIPLILGGHEASQWYREILGDTSSKIEKIPEIDYIIVGPGQPIITQLLHYLNMQTIANLPKGVACRFDGKIKFTEFMNFCPNQFAIPDYSLLPSIKITNRKKPLDIYSFIGNPHAGRIGSILNTSEKIAYLPLLTSYGCGFGCSFCDTDKNLVRYSTEKTLEIINQFENLFGIDYIDFIDNNFGGGDNTSRRTAFEILSEVTKSGYKIGFSNGLTFESMARDNFQLIEEFSKNGNVQHIAFPCENGNDRILRMIKKPHNLSVVKKVLEFAKKELVSTNREGFFIGGFPKSNGLPAEQPFELENTFQMIKDCLENQFLHQAIFLTLSPITREYRKIWRGLYPTASFENCLFSQKTGIWPYPNVLLEKMHYRVESINERLGRAVTRKL